MILKVRGPWGPDVSVMTPLYFIVALLILIRFDELNRHLDRYHRINLPLLIIQIIIA